MRGLLSPCTILNTDMIYCVLSFMELQGPVKGTLSPCAGLHGCFQMEILLRKLGEEAEDRAVEQCC